MKCAIIESPYGHPDPVIVARNLRYARACMKDSLDRGEAPFASHLLYTQVYDDNNPELRKCGIEAGLAIGKLMDKTVVYTNLGISEGMRWGIRAAEEAGRPIEYRELEHWR
jgi:hypothetical protein